MALISLPRTDAIGVDSSSDTQVRYLFITYLKVTDLS
jgi:hypothetical protein